MPTRDTDGRPYGFTRRGLLCGLAGGAALSIAGCTGDGGGADGGGIDPVKERVSVDPAEIQEGGTFRTALGEDIDTFDFPWSTVAQASVVHNLLYEGMVTTDATGKLYPWLAESWERVDVQDVGPADYEAYMRTAPYTDAGVPDVDAQVVVSHPDNDPATGEGRFLTVEEAPDAVADGTYGMHFRYSLHEGVTFHDGEELTADNVVASYRRVENSDLSGQLFDSLLHVAAADDYAVDLYVQEPDAAAVRELGGWPVFPTAVTDLPPEANDPREGNEPLGSGPFVFEDYRSTEFATLSRNDDWWFETDLKDWFDGSEAFPDGPVVDGVDIRFVPDPAQRSAALQNGELDMAYGLNASALTDYQAADDFRPSATDGAGYTFVQFPVRVEPWDDPRLRRAVNHLIPREAIVENVFEGWQEPAWVPLPPLAAREGTTDYDQLVSDLRSFNEHDPERAADLARQVVDERDVETPIQVTLETNSENDDRIRTVELIAQSMGNTEFFETNVETTEFLTFVGNLVGGEYHSRGRLAVIGLSGGFGPHGYAKAIHHPDNFAQCCNFQNVDDEELNEALRAARYGVDLVEDPQLRRERYEAVWERVLELNANSYTTHSVVVGVVDDAVEGFNSYPSTQDIVGYGLYSPMEEQITYLDRES